MTLSDSAAATKPSLLAAVLLWALSLLRQRAEWPQSVADVLTVTGAGRSQAYAMLARLQSAARTLQSQSECPLAEPGPSQNVLAVVRAVRDFVMDHPGVVTGRGRRRRYGVPFRRFVVGLREPGGLAAELTVEELADAAAVPVGTLKDWLRLAPASEPREKPEPESQAPAQLATVASQGEIATILSEWERWEGDFTAFCTYLRGEHRITHGDTFVGSVLEAAGRRARRRRGRTDPPWSRGTFRTLFPGVQWIGDGMSFGVRVNDRLHVFNLQPVIDPAADAVVGAVVTDTEDEQAVIDAFEASLPTSEGVLPLALTLDNRPSNHTPAVEAAIAPTTLLPATPGRGQAKAPCEGFFGLFQQSLPPLVLEGTSERDFARCAAQLVATAFARGRNGRPRTRLGGRTPADTYRDARPTAEDVEKAKDYIAELKRRAERARRSREARADPVRRALLTEALARLQIPDPGERIATRLAIYGLDAILRGIATFEAKRERGTVPPDVAPHRYLGGIIRRLDERLEIQSTADRLLAVRLRARDITLQPLASDLERLRVDAPPQDLPALLVDRALQARPQVDFRFWLHQAGEALTALGHTEATARYRPLARIIAAHFDVERDRRADLIDALAQAVARASPSLRASHTATNGPARPTPSV
jgi:hypothetical protein